VYNKNVITNKHFKADVYLLIVELTELVILVTCFICFFTCGLNKYVYICLVTILPFILTVMEFYPCMDIIQRRKVATYFEFAELGLFIADMALYITAMFVLNVQ